MITTSQTQFLARNYDVVEAENMLRQVSLALSTKLTIKKKDLFKLMDQLFDYFTKSLEWRRANKVDEILDTFTPPEAFVKYYSMNHIGTDKFDCPRK